MPTGLNVGSHFLHKPFLETYLFGMLKWPREQRREEVSTCTTISGKHKT